MSVTNKEKRNQLIFYTYILLDTRKGGSFNYSDYYMFDYEPFYVGKGHENRAHFHESEALSNLNNIKYLYNKIRKIIRETSNSPIIHIFDSGLTEDEAFELEKVLISNIGRLDLKMGPLLNNTNGGDGCSGLIKSDVLKEENRQRMIIWNNSMEPEYREKFLKALSDGVKKSHASRTEYEKIKQAELISHGLNSRGDSVKEEWENKISISNKEYWDSISEEDKLE